MSKDAAKEQVSILVQKCLEVVNDSEQLKRYNEEMTKLRFINPLFQALGWDIANKKRKDEVTFEDRVSRGRVDYGFRINGIPKFFVEAKSLKVDLDDIEFVKQAIAYAWNKGCTWAVLTNFRKIRIFNSEVKESSPARSQFFELEVQHFIDRFDQLFLLSRHSWEFNLLDKEAEMWGKKTKRVRVDTQLLKDFTRFRTLLSKNISRVNHGRILNEQQLDACVQRLLDRLMFIRNCEDKELEPRQLLSNLRQWENEGKGQLLKHLRLVFNYFNKNYDSKIFEEDLCDTLALDNEVMHEIIEGLHFDKDQLTSYDFSVIEADVLGNIYEQYLGNILKKTAMSATLTESQTHRKEQGIFYTPTYIVEYILRNTLGTLLGKNKKIGKIRILDPACGSGSFLIKAFDIFNEYYTRHDKQYYQTRLDVLENATYTRKLKILEDHIFGVDLDRQASEVAQLNLLLKVAEKARRLPLLQKNIKQGNSLIDNSFDASDRPFNWIKGFPEVIAEGGFDIIIGNPPYVFGGNTGITAKQKLYFQKNYTTAKRKLNLFSLFIERSIALLKNHGLLGFILPNTLLRVTSYEETRKFILARTRILQIVNLEAGVFEGVTASTVIIILQKEDDKNKLEMHKVNIYDGLGSAPRQKSQSEFWRSSLHIFDLGSSTERSISEQKFTSGCVKLGSLCKEMIFGVVITKNRDVVVSESKVHEAHKKFLEGRDIERYGINFANKYLLYEASRLHRPRSPEIFEAKEKILVQRISGGKRPLKAAFDDEQYYNKESINNIILSDDNYDARYILSILNSHLMNWYYATKFTNGSELTVNVSKAYLSQLPIKTLSRSQQGPLIEMATRMLQIKKQLRKMGENKTDERYKMEQEFKELDVLADSMIFDVYGLTEKDREIVESYLTNNKS